MDLLCEAGLTQQEFADLLGVRRETVHNWLTGKTKARFTPGELRDVCRVLKKTFDQLPDEFGPQADTTDGEAPG